MNMEEVLKSFDVFHKLVVDQFAYGGKKYANSVQKEATDCLFDKYGYKWLIGTIDKYYYRYGNAGRERDLLKMATYMFIMWLKRGYHVRTQGTEEPINTTVPVKADNFCTFKGLANAWLVDTQEDPDYGQYMYNVHQACEFWADENDFKKIKEDALLAAYCELFKEWEARFKDKAGQDADTFNDAKLK